MLNYQKMITKKSFLALTLAAGLVACKKDNNYEVPTTYNFLNVNYSGQTTRIAMLEEIVDYTKTSAVQNAPALSAQKLKDMYTNSNSPFLDAALNTSGKQLKDKTPSSQQDKMEEIFDSMALASLSTANITPSNGVAGIAVKNDGTGGYLLNSKGVQLAEIIEKVAMGAIFYFQATAVYFGSGEMDVDNINVIDGEGTAMQHHWDEAFGYFGVPIDFPTNTNDIFFWGEYCNTRDALMGSNNTMMTGFLTGRAAINNKDLDRRDEMIDSIRYEWERIAAASAISYLNKTLFYFNTDMAIKHHALTEAYGFIYALQFGGNTSITTAEVNTILTDLAGSSDPLQANFYTVTTSQIQAAIDALVGQVPSLESIKNDL